MNQLKYIRPQSCYTLQIIKKMNLTWFFTFILAFKNRLGSCVALTLLAQWFPLKSIEKRFSCRFLLRRRSAVNISGLLLLFGSSLSLYFFLPMQLICWLYWFPCQGSHPDSVFGTLWDNNKNPKPYTWVSRGDHQLIIILFAALKKYVKFYHIS